MATCKDCDNLEGGYCDAHREAAYREGLAEHACLARLPLSAITGKLSAEQEQDLRDAGRGHLVRS